MQATSRPFEGPQDFAIMARVISESWQASAPIVSCTVGDIEWWRIDDAEQVLDGKVRIWEVGERAVGWEWLDPPYAGDWHLQPGIELVQFLDPFLDRIEASAAAAPAPGSATPEVQTPPVRLATRAWAMDADNEAIAVLALRGYQPDGMARSHWVRALPAIGGVPVPEPPLPSGYQHASVRWPEDLAARVEVHRAAFAPSTMTLEQYLRLAKLPHYDPERDRVIVAPDGTFAAFANAWWDPDGLVGELEPVGAHPDHRRLGLARAACLKAIAVLEELGARYVVINTGRTNLAAEGLYESLGCVRVTTSRRYARPLDAGARRYNPAR
jgi:ribosomal protein S18 acetylase RimI-like enzyme